MNDLDYTGYGPTSAGRAPSAAELRRAAHNRYHSSRALQAMQYIDPATVAASERMVQLGMGADKSPQAVRRTLYGTVAGQATLDAAFAARSSGLLGYGDPREYSKNITQMVGGGMRVSIRGGALDAQAGRMQGFNQRVSGNGAIAERAAITMQKQMLDNLYGEGEQADPSRLNGYDMTEASQVAARVVGRSGMGHLMHLEKNADIGTRIASAMQSEVDPNVRAGLAGLTDDQKQKLANAERSGDSGELTRVINEVAATMEDPKAREALTNLSKSKHALVFNDENLKKVTDTVKEVTKGMAALNDIYGELSSDTAHAMLEQVHGGRITNKQQARAAARTVDNMRNAAEYAGMDPRQIMSMFATQQESVAGRVGDAIGLDNRSQQLRQKVGSQLAAKFTTEAVTTSADLAESYKALGLEGEAPSAEELLEDNIMMQVEAIEKIPGFLYSQGDLKGVKAEDRELVREKGRQIKEASKRGDDAEMLRLNNEIENMVGGPEGFDAYVKSGIGEADFVSGQSASVDSIREMSSDALRGNRGLMNQLSDLAGSDTTSQTVANIGGVESLNKLAEIDRIESTEEREKQRKQIFDDAGATEEERVQAMETLFGEDGKMKEQFKNYEPSKGGAAMSAEEGKKFNQFVLNKMGGTIGLSALAEIEKIKPTEKSIEKVGREQAEKEAAEERANERKKVFDKSEATEEERAQAMEVFYNEDGTMKDITNYSEVVGEVSRTGSQASAFVKNERAENNLTNLEKNDKRERMTDKDGKISIRGIAQGMFRGDVVNPLADDDTAAATLDALKSAGVPLTVEEDEEYTKKDGTKGTRKVTRDLTEMYESGIKLDNLDDEALKKINKVAGKEVNLVDRVNKRLGTKMTREEFIEKSKTEKQIQDASYLELEDAGSQIGFTVGGSRDNISVVNEKVQGLGGKFGDRLQKLKSLEAVSGFVSDGEMKKLTTSVLQGKDANIGDLVKADEYDPSSFLDVSHDKVKTKDGKGYAANLENSGKFQAIADITKSGDKQQIANVASMLGEEGLAEFDKQIATMESALASGDIDPINGKMVDDQGVERALNESTVNEFKLAVAALRAKAEEADGAQKIGTMTVTKLEVTGDFNSSKK